MIAVSTLIRYLPQIFQIAAHDSLELKVKSDVTHKVYIVTVYPTAEPVPKRAWSIEKRKKKWKTAVELVILDCSTCGGLLVNDLCMNKRCETNKKEP